MSVLFLFSIFPAVYPTEKFFKKRGSANAVIEYQYIRKILYGFLIALVVTMITFYFMNAYVKNQEDNLDKQVSNLTDLNEELDNLLEGPPVEPESVQEVDAQITSLHYQLPILFQQVMILREVERFLYIIVFVLPAVPISILLKLLLEHARKRFRFYYAKACFEIINETKDEVDKAGYLTLGLDWYNKFVKRVTKSSIDVETIYSNVISQSKLSDNILLDTIRETFHDEDELKPMRHMLALLSSWKEGVATLVKESLRTKIKESSDLLIPIVTVIITVITTFYLRSTQ